MTQATRSEPSTSRPADPAPATRESRLALASFLPPPTPDMTDAEKVALWADHPGLKQAGMMTAFWGGTLYVTFAVAITIAMRRIPGDRSIVSTAQAAMGTFGTVFFSANFLILAIIPFRDPPLIGLNASM